MQASIPIAGMITAALTGCGTIDGAREAEAQAFRDTVVEDLGEGRFRITVDADNVDGYELSRCVAVAYADGIRDEDGNRRFSHVLRLSGTLTDTFRKVGGVRTQTTTGAQIFELASEGSHDGADTLGVDEQLAACASADVAIAEG